MNFIEKLGTRTDPRRAANASADHSQTNLPQTNLQGDIAMFADEIADALYAEMIGIMGELNQLRIEDYDLPYLLEALIYPVASYLARTTPTPIKPLFVSGEPGIGKTTLLMILDEALHRLNSSRNLLGMGSCRDLVAAGEIKGYFPDKEPCHVAPLSLFGMRTAVVNARDWNNLLRCWTFDEDVARDSAAAIDDFVERLAGKVVIVDEAEIEGYVYFTELLAQRGILVILTSNLGLDHIRLAADTFIPVTLHGPDHREGDITRVCLPAGTQEWFDLFADAEQPQLIANTPLHAAEVNNQRIIYLDWRNLHNRPLLKDDFSRCFRQSQAAFVLLDHVPFFADILSETVGLTFLGNLFRFVNFVDAIHDCQLPLLMRGTHTQLLDRQTAGQHLRPLLAAYDKRTGSQQGAVAWIEWSRCLSRLRSREALNARFIAPESS